MPEKTLFTNRGIAISLVLLLIMVVVLIANILLVLISSQSRLTHHQINRIRAYYAAQAGINYAIEMLRREESAPGTGWSSPGAYTICPSGCTVNDADMPYLVRIDIGAPGSGINDTQIIQVSVTYTATLP